MLTQSIDVHGAIATIEWHVHETKQVAPESIRDSNREQIAHARQRIGCLLSDVRITYSSSSSSLPSSGSSTSSSGSSASCLRLRVDIVVCKRGGVVQRCGSGSEGKEEWKREKVGRRELTRARRSRELSERERGFLGGLELRLARIASPRPLLAVARCSAREQRKAGARGHLARRGEGAWTLPSCHCPAPDRSSRCCAARDRWASTLLFLFEVYLAIDNLALLLVLQ